MSGKKKKPKIGRVHLLIKKVSQGIEVAPGFGHFFPFYD
jgi:hypothetical protein